MLRFLFAVVAYAVIAFPLAATAQDKCGTYDSIKEESSRNGFEMTLFQGPNFKRWVAEVIQSSGPPPSGMVPDRGYVISGKNPLIVMIYLFTDDKTCDFVVAKGPTALHVMNLVKGTDI